MYKKLIVLFSFVSLLGLVNSAWGVGEEYHWDGGAGDNLWSSGDNWDLNTVPPHDSGEVFISGAGMLAIIPSGYTADCTFGVDYGRILGPEWGAQLDISGNLVYNWHMAPVSADPCVPSVINMYDGSTLAGEGIALGDNWWWHDGPYATMNMYGDAYADINWMFWGGHLNMYGGTMDIAGGLTVDTIGLVSDATRLMDIYDGAELLLPLGFTDTVNDWISRDILIADGGAGTIVVWEDGSRTHVVPEPSTVALLCLGGLALIRKKRS